MQYCDLTELDPELKRVLVQNARALAIACKTLAENLGVCSAEEWGEQIAGIARNHLKGWDSDAIDVVISQMNESARDARSITLFSPESGSDQWNLDSPN